MSTGIAGLDQILGGGLLPGRGYLIRGLPGSGKTSVGLHFVLEGAARGERCILFSLAESVDDIESNARSHGWSLEPGLVHEISSSHLFGAGSANTIFHPAEIELGETTRSIIAAVEERDPERVVIDSLSDLKVVAQDQYRFRREVLALKRFLSRRGATVLLLEDRHIEDSGDPQVATVADGVVELDLLTPAYGRDRRRLRISKLRGASFAGGWHDYEIVRGGLTVYPRLIASAHPGSAAGGMLRSGIGGLDLLTGGGLDHGTSTLLLGPAGTGKSTLLLAYAVAAARAGERAALFVFDERIPTIYARAAAIGFDLPHWVKEGFITIRQIDAAEMSPGEFVTLVRESVENEGARLVGVDTLNGYVHAMPEERFLTVQLHELLTVLAQKGTVTILVMAQHGVLDSGLDAPIDVSYVADTVMLLRFFLVDGEIRKAVGITKRRRGPHERRFRELRIGGDGISLGPPLARWEGAPMAWLAELEDNASGAS